MPGGIGETGLAQLDVPVVLAHQGVGVAKAEGVVGFAEGDGLLVGGAELLYQRVLAAGADQLDQVIGTGDIAFGQPGGLDIMCTGHAQRPRLGVHRLDEGRVATRIVVSEARGGAVLGRHQGQQQHLAAADLAADTHAGEHALHLPGIADGHRQRLIQRQLGVQHDHGGHQFGHRGDRHHHVRIAGIEHFIGLQIDQQGAAGGEFLYGRLGGLGMDGRQRGQAGEQQTGEGTTKVHDGCFPAMEGRNALNATW